MEKPNSEFFETLGQYVYKYIDDDGNVLYVGKGRGNRCMWHLEDKGYKLEHCYIVARNLEAFENKTDWQSFLLESWLIATETPRDNSVSGHYKECFVMASLSSMFADFKSDQYDNFESLPSWYIENYDQLRGRMRVIQITSGNIFFESATRNSVKMMWYWVPNSEDPIKVTFETLHKEEDKVKAVKSKIQEWLRTCGYSKTHKDGKDQKMAINVADIDALLELFSEFNA